MKFIYIPYLDELNTIKKKINEIHDEVEYVMDNYYKPKYRPAWILSSVNQALKSCVRLDYIDKFDDQAKVVKYNNPIKYEVHWSAISERKDLTIEFIRKHIDKPWDWKKLSSRFSYDDIKNNLDLPWSYAHVAINPRITMEQFNSISNFREEFIKLFEDNKNLSLKKYIFNELPISWLIAEKNNIDWPWNNLSSFSKHYLNIQQVLDNPDIPWPIKYKSCTLPIEDIVNNLHMEWCWESISHRMDIPFEFITSHMNLLWNWRIISCNMYIPWDFLIKNNIEFNIGEQSRYQPMEVIMNNLDRKWNWNNITINVESAKIIMDNPNLPWKYSWIKNKVAAKIPTEFIMNNIDLEWNKELLSRKLPKDYIMSKPDYEWDLTELFDRQEFSFDDLLKLDNIAKRPSRIRYITEANNFTIDLMKQYPEIKWSYHDYIRKKYWKLRELKREYEKIMAMFIKENVYYKLINRMHRPGGYYYKKDMEFIMNLLNK